MTVGTFLKEYPKGRYLIHVRSHAFTIIDGVVMGNLADARQMKCRIIDAYKFRKDGQWYEYADKYHCGKN